MSLKLTSEQLLRLQHETLHLDEQADLFDSLKKRLPDLISSTSLHVVGTLRNDGLGWVSDLKVTGTITLPSTRSLAPVELPVDLNIEELYVLPADLPSQDELEEMDQTVITIEDDLLNLEVAIEDHIILMIPTQIFSEDEIANQTMPAGEGWTVISEDQFAKVAEENAEQPNPEFAKLKDLFKDEDE
ncbi:YceD family protein [Lapidilactobacillus mulanensis]|uniref:YceD family protein n=1 Tax=Lapidilactobacillus mulanensis TaxID=2485999 RepID=A0ABW4DNX4_9LACO|nr:DUF177 domain-containing protein [Lapidilactobacillus mulanensis]